MKCCENETRADKLSREYTGLAPEKTFKKTGG